MLPVKPLPHADNKPGRALWLVIGARRIEWYALTGKGQHAEPQKLGSAAISTESTALLSLKDALQSLPNNWADDQGQTEGLRVLVADRWLSSAVLPWSPAMQQKSSAGVHARLQLQEAGFELSASDEIRLDDAPYGSPRLVVAYPADLMLALQLFAQRAGLRFLSVLPVSVATWMSTVELVGSRPQALAIINDDDIVIVAKQGALRSFDNNISELHLRRRTANLPAGTDLAEVWQRLCLRQPLWESLRHVALIDESAQRVMHESVPTPFVAATWLNGRPEQGFLANLLITLGRNSGIHAVDAVSNPRRMQLRHRVALGAAALIAGVIATQAVQVSIASGQLQTEVVALSQPKLRAASTSWTREEMSRVQAVNGAIRELNLPVNGLLRSLAPPRDIRAAVLSVETGGDASAPDARSSLKIVAQAPTSAEMARYVAFVSERTPFTGAYLTRHESVDVAGERFFRFTVEAQWND